MKKILMTLALVAFTMGAQAQDVVKAQDANNMSAKELEKAAKLQKNRDKAVKAADVAKKNLEKAERNYDKAVKAADKAKKDLEKAKDKVKDTEKEAAKLLGTPLVEQ